MLMSLRLQKLHVDSLVVLHWRVFRKTRPFVKWNNAECTNVSSFTSHLTCSTLFGRILLFSLPTSKIVSTLYILKSLESLPGGSCLGPLGVHFSVYWRYQNLTHFDSGLTISRTFLPCAGNSCTLLYCLYLVTWTQKINIRVHSLADTLPLFFFDHFTVFLTTD
jgi:hypothetical protein